MARIWLVLCSGILVPHVALGATFVNPLATSFIAEIVRGFILAVIYVGTPALVVAIVWTGFLFVLAQGNPEGLTKAKEMGVRVLLGGMLLLSLWAIVRLVGNTLAGLSSAALLIVLAAAAFYFVFRSSG